MMPSNSSTSTTSSEPWKGYQPYLTGSGATPSWLSQAAPTGLTPAMGADMAARAAGTEGSWLTPPPMQFPVGNFGGLPQTPPPGANTPGGNFGGLPQPPPEVFTPGGQTWPEQDAWRGRIPWMRTQNASSLLDPGGPQAPHGSAQLSGGQGFLDTRQQGGR